MKIFDTRAAGEAQQRLSQYTPGSTSQLLNDYSKLQDAAADYTREAKRGDLDVIVRGAYCSNDWPPESLHTDNDLSLFLEKSIIGCVNTETALRGKMSAGTSPRWAMGCQVEGPPFPPVKPETKGQSSMLEDVEVKMQMMEKTKGGFLKAQDLAECRHDPEMQAMFTRKGITKASISDKTALRWLEGNWAGPMRKLKNGMYLDGHERSDVVEYRKAFVERWMEHGGGDSIDGITMGTELPPTPQWIPGPPRCPLDASTSSWSHTTNPLSSRMMNTTQDGTTWTASRNRRPKGNGQSLMVSDFLTSDWGRLRDGSE